MLAKYRAHPPTSRTYYLVRVACDITTATAHAGSGSLALKAKRLLLGSVAGPCSLSPHPPRPHVTKTALMQGAKLLTGGHRAAGRGYFFEPAVLINVDHRMSLMTEESFGPVIGIMPVDSEEEAIRFMNDGPYGLTASIWTENGERGEALAARIAAGTVYVNRCDYLDPELAWVGIKDSGHGCTLSRLGFHYLTRPKSFYVRTQTTG